MGGTPPPGLAKDQTISVFSREGFPYKIGYSHHIIIIAQPRIYYIEFLIKVLIKKIRKVIQACPVLQTLNLEASQK